MRISVGFPLFKWLGIGYTGYGMHSGLGIIQGEDIPVPLPSFSIGNSPLPIITDLCASCIKRGIKQLFQFRKVTRHRATFFAERVQQCTNASANTGPPPEKVQITQEDINAIYYAETNVHSLAMQKPERYL